MLLNVFQESSMDIDNEKFQLFVETQVWLQKGRGTLCSFNTTFLNLILPTYLRGVLITSFL